MVSQMFQTTAVPASGQRRQTAWAAASAFKATNQADADLAKPDESEALTAVVRAVIEEFGGEVDSRNLEHLLARTLRSQENWLPALLQALELRNAVSLDHTDAQNPVVRIRPKGVDLAYDYPMRRAVR